MSTAHVLLTVAGTLLEVVGLTWIVVEASRARAAEFGERGLLRRVYDWFAYWLGPPGEVVSASITLSAGGGTATAGGGTVTVNETHIERLTRELAELRGRVERGEQAVGERFKALNERITAVESATQEHLAQLRERQQELRHSTLGREKRGAQLFILGALLSGMANLVP